MKINSFLLIFLLIITVGCDGDSTGPTNSKSNVVITPTVLSLTNTQPGYLWLVTKEDTEYNVIITKKPDWLGCEVEAFSLGKTAMKLMFWANVNIDQSKTIEGEIEITIVGKETIKIPVIVTIIDSPILYVNKKELTLTDSYIERLSISNQGGGLMNWKIVKSNPYILCTSDSGSIYKQGMIDLNVSIKKYNPYEPGSYSDSFYVVTEKDSHLVNVYFIVNVRKELIYPKNIVIDYITTDTTFYIKNYGNRDESWEFTNIPEYISVEPDKGDTQKADSTLIKMKLFRNLLDHGYFQSVMTLKNNSTNNQINISGQNYK